MHYPSCSNLAKNAIAMNEEHELSTVQQSKILSNVIHNKVAARPQVLPTVLTCKNDWLPELIRVTL